MPDAKKISELTSQALDQFEATDSVSALVRKAHRIASLRHDYPAQVWFTLQVRDLSTSTKPDPEDLFALRGKLIALLGEKAGQREYNKQARSWEATREMIGQPGKIHGASVGQIEALLAQVERDYADMQIPSNLHPSDAYAATKDLNKAKTKMVLDIGSLTNVLSRIRQATHDYLIATETEIDAGRADSSFFTHVYLEISPGCACCRGVIG